MKEFDLRAYMEAQLKEMLGPYNMWLTGLALGHPPTPEEAIRHYIDSGGPEGFRRRWVKNHGGHLREQSRHTS